MRNFAVTDTFFPPRTNEYLESVTKTGLYGLTHEEVIREFVYAGIRQAIRDGFIPLEGQP